MNNDEPTQEDIDRSVEYADMLIDTLTLPEEIDYASVMYSFFIYTIHALVAMGWTKEELIRDVHYHEAIETSEGTIQ